MTSYPALTRPDTPRPRTGVVHLGLGAFFRAHGAVYLAESMARDGGDWGVIGVSLRSPDTRDRLQPQGWAYTTAELGPDDVRTRTIDILNDVFVAPEGPDAVLDAMANPAVKIVSLTVTEKGYCLASSDGALDLDHPDIRHDIAHALPRSAPGFIVRALQRRRGLGHRPFTVLSLDNLPANGAKVKAAVLALADAIDPGLAAWIGAEARFPSSMVDRIVPATTDTLIAEVADQIGQTDAAPVGHEPFRQWVIEDDFVDADRPHLDRVGAQFTRDVTDFERMKLRMLNGTHSTIAYLGALSGFRTVAEATANPVLARFLDSLWQVEIIPTLTPPDGTNLAAYAEALMARYQNPAIQHRLEQIAMDGSQKLPQRLLGTLADNVAAGRDSARLTLAIAGWVQFLGGVDDHGQPLSVSDPQKDTLQTLIANAQDPTQRAHAITGFTPVFGDTPPPQLPDALAKALTLLDNKGARAAMEETT